MDDERAVVLFDGVCHLCDAFVQFVLEHDAAHRFDFAPLQGEFAQDRLGTRPVSSVVLVVGGSVFEAEDAVIRILSGLDAPWPKLAAVLAKLPRPLTGWGYRFVAKHRYRLFGRSDSCILPQPEWRDRFLA